MKHPNFRPVHKKREQTTNYAPDTHKEFCKRCEEFNKGCPRGKKEGCSL